MNRLKPSLYIALSYCLVLAPVPGSFADQPTQSTVQPEEHLMPELAVPQTPEQLQRLVAPIALYPDELVSQVLAAATYPDQIVQAEQWMESHSDLQAEQLGREVDVQPRTPSSIASPGS